MPALGQREPAPTEPNTGTKYLTVNIPIANIQAATYLLARALGANSKGGRLVLGSVGDG